MRRAVMWTFLDPGYRVDRQVKDLLPPVPHGKKVFTVLIEGIIGLALGAIVKIGQYHLGSDFLDQDITAL